MSMTRYLLISIGTIILLVAGVLAVFTYQGTKEDTYEKLYRESEAIYNFLMSVRRVYQQQFIESGIPLNDKTVGFLPAHSIPRISEEFSNRWDRRGIRVNTASDRPRNPRNMADAQELEAMAWFRDNDERTVYTREEDGLFLYARPVWVVKSCLKCHGNPEDAPPTIRARYEGAFGYEVGDLRGIMSIRIPMEGIEESVMDHFAFRFLILLVAFVLISLAVYGVVQHFVRRPLEQMVDGVRQISDDNNSGHRLPPLRGELGEFVGHFNEMMDQQERLQLELMEQRNEMEQILESMDEGVIVTDERDHILRINQKLEALTGWPSATHYGAVLTMLFAENSHPVEGHPGVERRKLLCQDGKKIPVQVSTGTFQHISGEGDFKVLVVHDLRERLRAEQQEEYAAYQAGIAEMSTMILHNVGNSLTAIDGGLLRLRNQLNVLKQVDALFERSVEMLDQHLEKQEDEHLRGVREIIHRGEKEIIMPLLQEIEEESLNPVEHSVRHISEIIRVQQGSAKMTTKATRFYLQEVINDALIMQQDTLNKLRIEVERPDYEHPVEVKIPKNQMIQALNNLLKNSHESIAERMQQEPNLAGRITLKVEQEPDQVRLSIEDNGMGIEAEQQEQMFRFGYTSKERGSGFGLHATANYIRGLGGDIELHSAGKGQGASVTITIRNQVE